VKVTLLLKEGKLFIKEHLDEKKNISQRRKTTIFDYPNCIIFFLIFFPLN
jgi:hypothetical protein